MRRPAVLLMMMALTMACDQRPEMPPVQTMEGAATSGTESGDPQPGTTPAAPTDSVTVDLIDSAGQSAGVAILTHNEAGVRVAIRARGLTPGEHGFHVHETGACAPPSFESAGSHFAPHGRQHGLQNPQGPHAGDMPNLVAGDDGAVDTSFVAPNMSLRPDQPHSVLREGGTALMIHADADDQRTDPSGNSGDRIVCGVIGPR